MSIWRKSWRQQQQQSLTTSATTAARLPLSGLRVLDLSRVLAGPFCTQILADYGATVLKVEQPGSGDETRQWRTSGETATFWKPEQKLMSLYFCAINRNKRSMTINLKSKRGVAMVKEMVRRGSLPDDPAGFDVVVHNFLPGKMEQIGLGYTDLKALNQRLIYAGVSGYGASGPSSKRAGYDAIALAEAGLLHITGTPGGEPAKPGVAIADLCTGLYTHGAILAAVNARHVNGGIGCKIESSLFESSLSLLINVGLASLNLDVDKGKQGRRRGGRLGLGHPNLVPYGAFKTQDARLLFIAANNNRQWKMLCKLLNLPASTTEEFGTNDRRVENRRTIDSLLAENFQEKPLAEWEQVFEGSGLPYGPINDVVQALEHPQSVARNMVIGLEGIESAQRGLLQLIGLPVKFGESSEVRHHPPLLGEHTEEVASELGYSREDIAVMRQEGVV